MKRSINVRTETFKGQRPLTKVRELGRRASKSQRRCRETASGRRDTHARRRSYCSNCGVGNFGGGACHLHRADRFGSQHGEAQESFASLVLVRHTSSWLADYFDRDGLPAGVTTLSELSEFIPRTRAPLRILRIRFRDSRLFCAPATSGLHAASILENKKSDKLLSLSDLENIFR